jgi:hypothetical protein
MTGRGYHRYAGPKARVSLGQLAEARRTRIDINWSPRTREHNEKGVPPTPKCERSRNVIEKKGDVKRAVAGRCGG